MRPHEVFAAMSPERAEAFFARLGEQSPQMLAQAVHAAALAQKSRPAYLLKQPLDRRVAAVRRALSRVALAPVAEEVLAVYFLETRKAMLVEWLDALGLAHEDGVLKGSNPACPEPAALAKAVAEFRARDDDPDRELLLRAFAAQSAIDWPALEELLAS